MGPAFDFRYQDFMGHCLSILSAQETTKPSEMQVASRWAGCDVLVESAVWQLFNARNMLEHDPLLEL